MGKTEELHGASVSSLAFEQEVIFFPKWASSPPATAAGVDRFSCTRFQALRYKRTRDNGCTSFSTYLSVTYDVPDTNRDMKDEQMNDTGKDPTFQKLIFYLHETDKTQMNR